MALLTITCLDAEGVLLPNTEVIAYLCDEKLQAIQAFDNNGYLIKRSKQISDALGVATFDLVPNADIHTPNTYFAIDVAGAVGPVLILKTSAAQTLEQAMVTAPSALESPLGLDNLWDVNLLGLTNGQGLRYIGSMWVPVTWPTGGGGGGSEKSWATISSTTTLTVGDADFRHKVDASAAPVTVNLPSAVGLMPLEFTIKRVSSGLNVVTVASPSGIDGAGTYLLDMQWESVTVSSDNAQWMVI